MKSTQEIMDEVGLLMKMSATRTDDAIFQAALGYAANALLWVVNNDAQPASKLLLNEV